MSAGVVEVRSEVFGSVEGENRGLPPVLLEAFAERVKLRDLIDRAVREQIRDLRARESGKAAEPKAESAETDYSVLKALERQYLTPGQISESAREGRVGAGAPGPKRVRDESRGIEADAEVGRALAAFEAGTYVVYAADGQGASGGRQLESLEEEIVFAPGTRVTFLRLMPLVGG